MRISISGYGEDSDDRLVNYVLRAENDDFKGTIRFYDYANVFTTFANALVKLPFESPGAVKFNASGVIMTVSLLDKAGRINVKVHIRDDDSNSVEFNDTTAETQMLHDLAALLKSTDFSRKVSIEWNTDL